MSFNLQSSMYDDFEFVGKREGFESLSLEIDELLEAGTGVTDHASVSSEGEGEREGSSLSSGDHLGRLSELDAGMDWTIGKERRMSFEFFSFPFEGEGGVLGNLDLPSMGESLANSFPELPNISSSSSMALKRSTDDSFSSSELALDKALSLSHGAKRMKKEPELVDITQRKQTKTPLSSPSPPLSSSSTPKKIPGTCPSGKTLMGTAVSSSSTISTPTSSLSLSSLGSGKAPVGTDEEKKIGAYTVAQRRERVARFHAKRLRRVWKKCIKYDCRKKLADDRPRIKGRFVKRSAVDEDEGHSNLSLSSSSSSLSLSSTSSVEKVQPLKVTQRETPPSFLSHSSLGEREKAKVHPLSSKVKGGLQAYNQRSAQKQKPVSTAARVIGGKGGRGNSLSLKTSAGGRGGAGGRMLGMVKPVLSHTKGVLASGGEGAVLPTFGKPSLSHPLRLSSSSSCLSSSSALSLSSPLSSASTASSKVSSGSSPSSVAVPTSVLKAGGGR